MIPNPGNKMAVDDIKRVQEVIARESRQLVYTHFNLVVGVPAGTDLQKCTNHLENAFGRMGIHISKRAYNQLELFVSSFPGNCYSLSEEYDRFLTLSDAAMCLMHKERVLHSEDTPLKISACSVFRYLQQVVEFLMFCVPALAFCLALSSQHFAVAGLWSMDKEIGGHAFWHRWRGFWQPMASAWHINTCS